jgi:hypothetical protein
MISNGARRNGVSTSNRPRALFICGSINQTKQLHATARELSGEVEAFYTPYYGDTVVEWMRTHDLIETTIGGNKRRGWCLEYLKQHELALDMHGKAGGYDLVVTCTDLVVPKNVRSSRLVVVQEGMFDPDGRVAALCRALPFLPRWFAGTALTGESFLYDRFCAASEGFKRRLIRRGADPDKIVVTGIPNFDDCEKYYQNDFPHHGYVLVCTSDLRETYQRDDRSAFVDRVRKIAAGRQVIFKLHPNETEVRARRELGALMPEALVFQKGSAEEMIANCEALVTQWSSTVFVGMALGKEVYSNAPLDELRELVPWQNGGTSAARIADVCRDLLSLKAAAPAHVTRSSVLELVENS